jgi:hypothetical protein
MIGATRSDTLPVAPDVAACAPFVRSLKQPEKIIIRAGSVEP